jgi:hypothetical protein
VKLTIDRLVLRGFPANQRDALTRALHAELARQLSDAAVAGAFGASRATGRVIASPLHVAPGSAPQAIGAQAARSLVRRLRS